ncbi:MAG: hypothetical protein AAGK80_08225 [Pseudomonadota bacterium]
MIRVFGISMIMPSVFVLRTFFFTFIVVIVIMFLVIMFFVIMFLVIMFLVIMFLVIMFLVIMFSRRIRWRDIPTGRKGQPHES